MPVLAGAALLLSGACSLLAPPDSELVRTPPSTGEEGGSAGSSGKEGGAPSVSGGAMGAGGAAAGAGGEEEGGNSPGKPVDVGVPSGEWVAAGGLKTRWATEVEPAAAHADYPRPDFTRHTWASLNGLWEYAIDDSADDVPDFDGAKLLVPFPLESQLSGVSGGALGDGEYLWYRRSFRLPAAWRDRRLLLHFGGVDWEASVRVNGEEVTTHHGGFDAFSVDITAQLAAQEEQELVVRVADPTDLGDQPRGKQALVPDTGNSLSAVSGIWQSVWLEPIPELSLQGAELSGDPITGAVTIVPRLSDSADGALVRAIVFDRGSEIARAEAAAGSAIELGIPEPKPWTPESPQLYDVTLELERDGVVVDSADTYLGLRSVALESDAAVKKLFLNGEPYLSLGVLSQGYWPDGLYTPPSDAALKADLTLIKNLGFNAVRVQQKLESPRFYYWADRLGVLVWQDMPAGDNSTSAGRELFGAELSEWVSERAEHPSLVAWTLFGSSLGLTGADVPALVAQVKALTNKQLVLGASGRGDEGSGDLRDRPDSAHVSCPEPDSRGVVLGQYGSQSRAVTGHTWSGNTGAVQTATDTARFVDMARRVRGLGRRPGASGAFFQQLTDVENELDGLVTYDRAVTKVTAKLVAEANAGASAPLVPLLQASEFDVFSEYLGDARRFRYTESEPASNWMSRLFDDASWTEAPAGIGDTNDAGARIRTKLGFGEIWLRTSFTLDEKPSGTLLVRVMYDEDTQVFVNDVRAADVYGWISNYQDFLGSDGAVSALVEGENVLAIHTNNTNGGRYIDVGLWVTDEPPALREADMPASTAPGLSYLDYDLSLNSLPADLTGNSPRATGVAADVGSYQPALAADPTRALHLHGYIEVPADGVYTFYVDTDDGARLLIGTKRVAEAFRNDGTNITKRAGNIALAAGKHEITIDYFANDNQGDNVFGVTWAGPGFEQTDIAASALSH